MAKGVDSDLRALGGDRRPWEGPWLRARDRNGMWYRGGISPWAVPWRRPPGTHKRPLVGIGTWPPYPRPVLSALLTAVSLTHSAASVLGAILPISQVRRLSLRDLNVIPKSTEHG